MMRSFNTAVSGLKTNQVRMDVIGNNIANVNTTAYKGSRATFSEMFSQTLKGAQEPQGLRGGINPEQIGLGSQLASIDVVHTQGPIQSTGRNTDLAVQGKGFFVVRDSQDIQSYTRDGNFGLDAQQRLVSTEGQRVQGFMADGLGNINTNGGAQDLTIPTNRTLAPKATSRVDLTGNLAIPKVLTAADAYASRQGNAVNQVQPITGVGAGAGQFQLGATNPDRLDAGEFTLNGVSITGQLPSDAVNDSTISVMQKMADLINYRKTETGVVATVKQTGPSGAATTPQAQLVLTATRPGLEPQVTIGGNAIPSIGGTALFTAGTTTIEAQAVNNGTGTNAVAAAAAISVASGDIVVNGVDMGALPSTAATNTSEQNAQALVGLINAKTDLTGVTAFTNGNGRISLKSTARDIILSGRTISDTALAQNAAIPGTTTAATNISGLFRAMNTARTATSLAGTTTDVFDATGTRHAVAMDFVADYDVIRETPVGGTTEIIVGTRDKRNWNWAASSTDNGVAVLSSNGNLNAQRFDQRNVTFNDKGVFQDFSGNFTLNFLNKDASASASIFGFNTNLSQNVNQPQPLTVDLGVDKTTTGLTQFNGPNSLGVIGQNGYGSGEMSGFNISLDGTISGMFSNGQQLKLAKLALATFANPEGLIRGQQNVGGGGNIFQETVNSGTARIGSAQAGGNGSIVAGALEGSNVDMAQQFTDMILTQRGFQANSRTITTSDEMLQEVLALKR